MKLAVLCLIGLGSVIFVAFLISYYCKKRVNLITQSYNDNTNNNDPCLNQIIVPSVYSYGNSIEEEWYFKITSCKTEKISIFENKGLNFNKDCTIQANHFFLHNSKPGYFEIEILNLEREYRLYFGLAPFADDINTVQEHSLFLNCSKTQIELYTNLIKLNQISVIEKKDILGILYLPSPKNQVTFTLNGHQLITVDFSGGIYGIYPTIFASKGVSIRYNFGHYKFKYDIANLNSYDLVKLTTSYDFPPSYR